MQPLPFPMTLADRLTIRHFRRALPRQKRSDFDRALSCILKTEADYVTDAVTQGHILMAASVVCLFRQLQAEGYSRPEARTRLLETMTSLWQRTSAIATRLSTLLSKDPFESIRSFSKRKVETGYGPSFQIKHTEHADGFASIVTTCGYRTFLARHGESDLIDVFCQWDRVWIDALPSSIGFRRPTTLAQGHACCRFEFKRR